MKYKGFVFMAAVLPMAFALLFAMVQPVAAEISDDAAQREIKAGLDDGGIVNVTTEIGNDTATGGDKFLMVSHRSQAGSTEGLAVEIEAILSAFLGEIKKGWECDSLAVIVGTKDGGIAGTWYCDKEWKDKYLQGTMTMDEVCSKAIESLEPWSI
jgi:hypothetical protein